MSLKDKRQVIRSLVQSLRNSNLSLTEVGRQNEWQMAVLGIAVVTESQGDGLRLVDEAVRRMEYADGVSASWVERGAERVPG